MFVAPVRKEIVVEASQARAFRVFTAELGAWWPLASHHIGEKAAETAIIEPRAGGRWFERAADGTECPWGKVLVWDPPGRIVLSWEIGANFKYDPELSLEVEIRFVVLGPASTRIELEHRDLQRHSGDWADMREKVNAEGGWGGLLALFGTKAEEGA